MADNPHLDMSGISVKLITLPTGIVNAEVKYHKEESQDA